MEVFLSNRHSIVCDLAYFDSKKYIQVDFFLTLLLNLLERSLQCAEILILYYFFEVGSQTFRNDYKIWRLQPQNSTSIVKNALTYISKIASNQCICSKD